MGAIIPRWCINYKPIEDSPRTNLILINPEISKKNSCFIKDEKDIEIINPIIQLKKEQEDYRKDCARAYVKNNKHKRNKNYRYFIAEKLNKVLWSNEILISYTIKNKKIKNRKEIKERVWDPYYRLWYKNNSIPKTNRVYGRIYFFNKFQSFTNRLIEIENKKSTFTTIEFMGTKDEWKFSYNTLSLNCHLNKLRQKLSRIIYFKRDTKLVKRFNQGKDISIVNITRSKHSRTKWVYEDNRFGFFPLRINGYEVITRVLESFALFILTLRGKVQKMRTGGEKKHFLTIKKGRKSWENEMDGLEEKVEGSGKINFRPSSYYFTFR